MENEILRPEIQQFIIENTFVEISKLALQKKVFSNVDYKSILNQIEARAKSKTKLPSWFITQNIVYPSKVSVEQTSSEITAKYKSQVITGESIIDLTGGFGVDCFYFSKSFKKLVHCELNSDLSEIVSHNFKELKVSNCIFIDGDSTEILKKVNQKFDWIFIDPSRRNEVKGKVFMLKDCMPNVPDLQDFYFNYSDKILIKTAPFLDISAGLLELKKVKNIHIIAVENEVKELLWEIDKNFIGELEIKTINITKTKNEYFNFKWNSTANCSLNSPQKYVYEPNAAIMKSGGFDEVGLQFNLKKLHKFSHLYTGNELIDFCGRVFEIEKTINYSKSDMKTNLENKKMNITTRNFPDSVENIRKKWKISEGGNQYCFFTTDKNDNKIALICKKI